jgi:uncharacterized protein
MLQGGEMKRMAWRHGPLLAVWAALLGSGTVAQAQAVDSATAVRVAQQFVAALQEARYGEAAGLVAPAAAAQLGAAQLETVWGQVTAGVGALQRTTVRSTAAQDTLRLVELLGDFERQRLLVRVVVTPTERVAGFFLLPAPSEAPPRVPEYADTTLLREEPVEVGAPGWRLPGTLTLPRGAGPHPVVVLVHGSGPHDRDETLGPNRPFRDLALGLASRGVAVLRYDKRTLVHGARMGGAVTVEEEVIADALTALAVARAHPDTEARRVYVLGHSLGGLLAPEIGARDAAVAGVILLAAPARPLTEVILDQLAHLGGLPQNQTPQAQAGIAGMRASVEQYRAGQLPDTAAVMGMPQPYLRDLDARDPVAAARRLTVPLLVLHGRRDYQVPAQDYELWQAAFAGAKSAATLRSFPDLNHLFMRGTGTPNPAEYEVPAHVDGAVIEAIAGWIRG